MQILTRSRARKALAPRLEPTPRATEDCGYIPIGQVAWRSEVSVQGRVRSMRIQPWADVASLECTLVDESGGITVVFLGRRHIAGVQPGTTMRVSGMAGSHHNKLAIMNPEYSLIATPHIERPSH